MAGPRFLGWRVAGCLALAQGCGIGLLQAFGVLVPAVGEAFALSDTQVGLGMTAFIAGLAIAGALLGPVVDRGPIRKVMFAGIAVMGAGAIGMGMADSAGMFAAGLLLAAVGIAGFGPLPVNAILVRWFQARRGTALAVAAAGPAAAGFVVPLLAARLLGWGDYRSAILALMLGGGALALALVAFGVVVSPSDAGQHPDGRAEASPVPAGEEDAAAGFAGSRDFWLIGLGFGFVFCLPVGVGPFLPKFLIEGGASLDAAALSVSVMAFFAFAGSLSAGALADRFGVKVILLGFLAAGATAFGLILVAPSYEVTLAASGGIGLATGGVAPLHPLLVGGRFGAGSIARVLGLQGPIGLPSLLAAAPVAGLLVDRTGGYAAAFALFLAVLLAGGGCLALARARPPT